MEIVSKTQYYPHHTHTHTELLACINSIQLQSQIQSHFSKTDQNTSIQQHKNPNTNFYILRAIITLQNTAITNTQTQQTHFNCHPFHPIPKLISFFLQKPVNYHLSQKFKLLENSEITSFNHYCNTSPHLWAQTLP